jgi:hypothetical protein
MRAAALALALTFAASGPGFARQGGWVPPPKATTVEPLVVTAARRPPLTGHALDKALDQFVGERAAATRVGRLARWKMPICPETIGLTDELNAEVTARILQVGAAVGAPARAKGTCLANIEIVFTPAPQLLMNRVKDRLWILLGYHYASQTKALSTMTRPIQAWWVTGTRSEADTAGAAFQIGAVSAIGSGELAIDDAMTRSPSGSSSGPFDTSLASEFANVLVVIDQARVAGASTQAIADYVAMLVFAEDTDLSACGALASILDLYAGGGCDQRNPGGLTGSDLAYLKALYSANIRVRAVIARNELADHMRASLTGR